MQSLRLASSVLKLIASHTSPYARKVRIALAEKKLEYQVSSGSSLGPATRSRHTTRSARCPCLMLDDGRQVYDSRVIVEYLDGEPGVAPHPRARTAAHRREDMGSAGRRPAMQRRRSSSNGAGRRTCKATNGSIASAEDREGVAELSRELGDARGARRELLARGHRDGLRARLSRPSLSREVDWRSRIRTSSASPTSSASARRSPKRPLRVVPATRSAFRVTSPASTARG